MLGGNGRDGSTSSTGPACPEDPMNTPPESASGKLSPVAAPKVLALGKNLFATAAEGA